MICYEGRDVVHNTLVGDWSRRTGRLAFLLSTGRNRTEQPTPDVSSSVVSSDVLLEVALEVGRLGRHGGSRVESVRVGRHILAASFKGERVGGRGRTGRRCKKGRKTRSLQHLWAPSPLAGLRPSIKSGVCASACQRRGMKVGYEAKKVKRNARQGDILGKVISGYRISSATGEG